MEYIAPILAILAALAKALGPLFPSTDQIAGENQQALKDQNAASEAKAKMDAVTPVNPDALDGRLLDGSA